MRLQTLLFLLSLSAFGCEAKFWKSLGKKVTGSSSRRAVEQPVHEPEEAPAAQEIGESSGAGPDETPAPQQQPTSPRAVTCKDYVKDFVHPSATAFLENFKTFPKPPLDPPRSYVFDLLTAYKNYVKNETEQNSVNLVHCLDRTLDRGIELAMMERDDWALDAELAYILGTLAALKTDDEILLSNTIEAEAKPVLLRMHEALMDQHGADKDDKFSRMTHELLIKYQMPASPRAISCRAYVKDFVHPSPAAFLENFETIPKPPLDPPHSGVFYLLTAYKNYVKDETEQNSVNLVNCIDRTLDRGIELAMMKRDDWALDAELAYILGSLAAMNTNQEIMLSNVIAAQAKPVVRRMQRALKDEDGAGEDEKFASLAHALLSKYR